MHWNAPLAALGSKNFLGEVPQTPLQETIPLRVPLAIRVNPPPTLVLCTFQTFLPKPILAPVYSIGPLVDCYMDSNFHWLWI